jgi:hypothetical protein
VDNNGLIKCNFDSRKKLLQVNGQGPANDNQKMINGIDYIEVKRVINPSNLDNSNHSDSETNVASSEKSSILLLLFLFKEPIPNMIEKDNLIILGGSRIKNVGIKLAGKLEEIFESLDKNEKEIINSLNYSKRKKLIVIKPTKEGDFSIYTLILGKKGNPQEPLSNFDPMFSQIDFSFKIDCALDFDCKIEKKCPPVTFKEPLINYMAKDYASFVKLILSRFSHIIPDWKEKSAADLTNVLVELLCFVGDHLSYYQDAVSTEAYLGTAQKRISVRRHARLLDYFINEGSNARTWVYFNVNFTKEEELKVVVLKKSTKVLTGEPTKDKTNFPKLSISEDELKEVLSISDTMVFETMHEINLYTFHNEMFFYTWGKTDCCLPKGATHATLLRDMKNNNESTQEETPSLDIRIFSWNTIEVNNSDQNNIKNFIIKVSSVFNTIDSIGLVKETEKTLKMFDTENPSSKFISIELLVEEERAIAKDDLGNIVYEFMAKKSLDNTNEIEIYGLSLNTGDVLIFEEKLSPTTLKPSDKDPSHRQAVKLRDIKRKFDPVNNVNLVEIYWDEQDALMFPLCINKINYSSITNANDQNNNINDNGSDNDNYIKTISVARGNIVLVDHGFTIKNEKLEDVPKVGIFNPKLEKFPITFAYPYLSSASAYSSIYCKQQIDSVLNPSIIVMEGPASVVLSADGSDNREQDLGNKPGLIKWFPNKDLLSSDKFAKEFVVELDNDGIAYLRFGDGKNGQKPMSKMDNDIDTDSVKFYANYRIGNGKIGNIGYEKITRIVIDPNNQNIIKKIRNICNPLPAIGGTDPESLNEVRQNAPVAFMKQERAVTVDDYASILKMHPEVQRAMAVFRWTGSWYTVFVIIDRIGGKIVDDAFKLELYSLLNKFRLAGYDLEINSPNYVSLDIKINICVKPNHYPEEVKQNLLSTFSTQVLDGNKIGFFHPDNFTFGQPLYLSKIYQTIMNSEEGINSIFVEKFQRMGKKDDNLELEIGIIQVHSSEIIRLDNDPNFPDNGKIEFVMSGGV